ncbi:unnamed protein product [Sympodiomycopsis kandeliae]
MAEAGQDEDRTATLKVGGMTCGACVESIEKMLRNQPGITSVSVALLAERAVVKYCPTEWSAEKVASEIEDIGFDAEVIQDTAPIPASTTSKGETHSDKNDAAEPSEDETTLSVYGMTCSACVATIEKGLTDTPGVLSCSVALATEKAKIVYDAQTIGIRDLVERVEEMGFDAVLSDDRDSTQLQSLSRVKEVAQWKRAFTTALSFAIPVFLISMVLPKWSFAKSILFWQPIPQLWLTDILCFSLTIPVQFGVGRRFYRVAWKALKHGSSTMDVLVVFGTTAAFIYSTISMIGGIFCSAQVCNKPATFFDTSTMLITFVSVGRYLENKAKGKTSEALSRLISLAPSAATIYTDGEKLSTEKKINGELVQRGDYVKVVPGDKIPADGVVVRGSSTVDESVVTGESMPVTKKAGSQVIGGTVNGLGTFDFRVERAGKDTSLSQIVKLVSEAQTSKAPIQAFADRIAGVFVPCVIGLGLLTLFCWLVISHALGSDSLPNIFHDDPSKFAVCLKLCISVVVVACPCALGLATPTAVMVGTGVGAQNGILIKGGAPLEASIKIKRILFDKTGTLTQGKLAVSNVAWVDDKIHRKGNEDLRASSGISGVSKMDAIHLVGTLEKRSEHPHAAAIVAFAARSHQVAEEEFPIMGQTAIENFESKTGKGVKGTVRLALADGRWSTHIVVVGNLPFVCSADNVPTSLSTFAAEEQALTRTLAYASIDGRLIAVFSLADQIKPEARLTIETLHKMKIETYLVTGDTPATAQAVASEVRIHPDNVYASMTPSAKSDIVEQLRLGLDGKGGVAFVGDGINDSPALASSDVGIALSSGSDIALESSSIVLTRNSLLDVPISLLLSKRIFLQIRLNFAWATAYNVIALPLAMGLGLPWGWNLHPMFAAGAMAASSVSVVTASLTLKLWRKPRDLVRAERGLQAGSGVSQYANADSHFTDGGSQDTGLISELSHSISKGTQSILGHLPLPSSLRPVSTYQLLPSSATGAGSSRENGIEMV